MASSPAALLDAFKAEPGQSRSFLLRIVPSYSEERLNYIRRAVESGQTTMQTVLEENVNFLAKSCCRWGMQYKMNPGNHVLCYMVRIQPPDVMECMPHCVLVLITFNSKRNLSDVERSMTRTFHGIMAWRCSTIANNMTTIGDLSSLEAFVMNIFLQKLHGLGNAYSTEGVASS